ncbi:MAG: deoxynucleoside kinase [Anaerolineaceae bacterium]|nr:deoxynucleoside kinase [Anaerolineaceae bacterium]
MKKFIAIAGNIGVGKSSLVKLLCEQMDWSPVYEPVNENPYLADFYKNMEKWGFHSQIFFLSHRILIHKEIMSHSNSVIQDRSIYEDAEIFARNLYHQGFISDRDFKTYYDLYQSVSTFLLPPDLLIYLKASESTLQKRIQLRNRSYEKTIPSEYLLQLNTLYEQWIEGFSLCPVLTIQADDLDYVADESHLGLIKTKVQEKLTGKDQIVFPRRSPQEE